MIVIGLIVLLSTGQLSYACIGGSAPANCCASGCANTYSSGCPSPRPAVGYQHQQSPQVYSQYVAPGSSHGIYAQVPPSYINSGASYSSASQKYSSGPSQQLYNIPQIPPQSSYVSPIQNQLHSQYYNSGPVSQPSYTNNVPVYSGIGQNAKGAIYQTIQQTVSHEQTQPYNGYDSSPNVRTYNQPAPPVPIQTVETVKESTISSQPTGSISNTYTNKQQQFIPEQKSTTYSKETNIISQSYNEQTPQISSQNIESTQRTETQSSITTESKNIVQVSPSVTRIEETDYHDQEHEPIVTSKETVMKTNIVPYTNEVMPPNPPAVSSSQLDGKVETVHVSEILPKGPDYQFQQNDKIYTQEKEEVVSAPGVNDEKIDETVDNVHIGENVNNNVIHVSENSQNIKVIQNVVPSPKYEKNEASNTLGYGEETTKQKETEVQQATDSVITTNTRSMTEESKEVIETTKTAIVPVASEIYSPASTGTVQNTDGSTYEESTNSIKFTTSNPIIIQEPTKSYKIRRIYFRHRN